VMNPGLFSRRLHIFHAI